MLQICIIGSGNWGTAIAKLIAENVSNNKELNKTIVMWVYEENFNGKSLTKSINVEHENPKYLPKIKLPANLVANNNLAEVTKMADIILFALPPEHLSNIAKQMVLSIKPGARAISLMKGIIINKGNGLVLLSDLIHKHLKVECSVVMGANRAGEVASKMYGEATIGCRDPKFGALIKSFLQTDYFRLVVTTDVVGVELCGALKNIVALAAGIVDGLGHGDNTKAAFIRLGYWEIEEFMRQFYKDRGVNKFTVLQSCGFAEMFQCLAHDKNLQSTPIDLCYGSRNILAGMSLVTRPQASLADIERDVLAGALANGAHTVSEVVQMLTASHQQQHYPLMTTINLICQRKTSPASLIITAQNHPAHH